MMCLRASTNSCQGFNSFWRLQRQVSASCHWHAKHFWIWPRIWKVSRYVGIQYRSTVPSYTPTSYTPTWWGTYPLIPARVSIHFGSEATMAGASQLTLAQKTPVFEFWPCIPKVSRHVGIQYSQTVPSYILLDEVRTYFCMYASSCQTYTSLLQGRQ